MSNPLTGDFEAVLQVSGATVNRLLASMHQNAFANPSLPSFPHSVRMRIGDDHPIDGVRGRAYAQVSVPSVELINGATDRFWLSVSLRAWFRPDPGTTAFPAFINGTVRAEYRLEDIDPTCLGWAKLASQYLWIRVVPESVTFHGTADDDVNPLDAKVLALTGDPAAVDAANLAKVTHQIAGLLATRFEATPHPVSKRFRRGAMRSLNTPNIGSAVALPIGITGDPVGNVASIQNVLVNDSDLAIAVNLDYIMSLLNPTLAAVQGIHETVHIHVSTPWYMPDIDTVYRAGVNPATVAWTAFGTYAEFKINIHGWANTDSVLANATFDVEQIVTLGFDAGSGRLVLTPGKLSVNTHASGLGSGTVADAVSGAVTSTVKPIVQAACNQAQPSLDAMTSRTQELSQQLASLDDKASVTIDQAEFTAFGIVLRGTIGLAARHAPVVTFDKTPENDALNALDCWIPGGRIDRFEWSWSWAGSGDPGSTTRSDRFLLRRPAAKSGRWGMGIGLTTPLPGLDGSGTVCLTISGVRVDPVTGRQVSVHSTRICKRFGLNISDSIKSTDRLYLRDIPESSQRVPFSQLALIGTRSTPDAAGTANTLVLHVDEDWNRETEQVLQRGIEACGRYDAGLAILVLFREGLLESAGDRRIADIEAVARKLGIAASVNEDVHGAWSRALGLASGDAAGRGGLGWAIVSPNGIPIWTQQGRIKPEALTAALDAHLRRAPDPAPVAFQPGIAVGQRVPATALIPSLSEPVQSHCPPVPLGRLGLGGAQVAFVQGNSAASLAELRQLATASSRAEDQPGPVVVAVVDGATPQEAARLKSELGVEFIAVADPSGTIADRFGIGVWPTTVTLDRIGTVSAVQAGGAAHPHRHAESPTAQ